MNPRIVYTKTDEAPALATASLLPIIKIFTNIAGIEVEVKNISLSARILAAFPEILEKNQLVSDDLDQLASLVRNPEANIIKLPNISASVTQLQDAILELQGKGFRLPEYPEYPETDKEYSIKKRYDKIKGSAVNPVLREGNSDRRVPAAVKKYAVNHPHTMGKWSSDSKTCVASMTEGDFYGSEQSVLIEAPGSVRVELEQNSGGKSILKESIDLEEGEILDSAVMSVKTLRQFIKDQIVSAKNQGLLFSVHLKATMMKISDPVIFGHVVSVFFEDVFNKYKDTFRQLGVNPNNGIGDLLVKVNTLPLKEKETILAALEAGFKMQPDLAMVNIEKGITNLHVSNNVIIDASMPAAIRSSGKMWGPNGKLQDILALIPDRSYAGIYQETINFCKKNGAFDPRSMGSVSNVGLMARKAEEYGSHDKTFVIANSGIVRIIDSVGAVLMEQKVEKGDIFRMCQVKDEPIRDWVKLAVTRAESTGLPAVFWLDDKRAHDLQVIKKVKKYLLLHDINKLDIKIMSPNEAIVFSLQRTKEGRDTISVTGNILRDYLTDLFPIMELGSSSKMLSIVPLMNGGGLFETGAGGTAPALAAQFFYKNYLEWDSLGEYLALAVSLEYFGKNTGNKKALILSETLNGATEVFLENNRSPSGAVNEIDCRGSHYYLTLYWAQFLAAQNKDIELKTLFAGLADKLAENEKEIIDELLSVQGDSVDLDGNYLPDPDLLNRAMRPSGTFNRILETIA